MERPAATGGLGECGCRLRRHQFLSQSRDSLELCLEQLYPSGMYLMEVQLSVVTGWGGGLKAYRLGPRYHRQPFALWREVPLKG